MSAPDPVATAALAAAVALVRSDADACALWCEPEARARNAREAYELGPLARLRHSHAALVALWRELEPRMPGAHKPGATAVVSGLFDALLFGRRRAEDALCLDWVS